VSGEDVMVPKPPSSSPFSGTDASVPSSPLSGVNVTASSSPHSGVSVTVSEVSGSVTWTPAQPSASVSGGLPASITPPQRDSNLEVDQVTKASADQVTESSADHVPYSSALVITSSSILLYINSRL